MLPGWPSPARRTLVPRCGATGDLNVDVPSFFADDALGAFISLAQADMDIMLNIPSGARPIETAEAARLTAPAAPLR